MGVKRIFILVLLACLGTSHYMLAKKKSTKTSLASVSVLKMSNDSTEYKKLVKDTKTKKGLFVTHFSKAHKLYFEIPDTAFFHTYLLQIELQVQVILRILLQGRWLRDLCSYV